VGVGELTPEFTFDQLPGRRAGQFVDELESPGQLVSGDPVAQVPGEAIDDGLRRHHAVAQLQHIVGSNNEVTPAAWATT